MSVRAALTAGLLAVAASGAVPTAVAPAEVTPASPGAQAPAAASAGLPGASSTPRLVTRIELLPGGGALATLELDATAAAPGLTVLPRPLASIEGTGVRLQLVLTNGSGAMAYDARVRFERRGADGTSTLAMAEASPGLAPGESAEFSVHVPGVTDPARRVTIHAVPVTGIAVVAEFGGHGRAAGQMSKPRGLAVAPDGSVIVADRGNNRIQVFDRAGRAVREWGRFGTGAGEFDHPEDVALDARRGRVFACDMNNGHVQVFTLEGRHHATLPGAGQVELDRPSDLALSPDGAVLYVVDSGHLRVVALDAEGRLLRTWGSWGEGPGEFRAPLDIETDAAGRVYVSDGANRNVQVFDPEGRHLVTLAGTARAPLRYPSAVMPIGGDRVLIADFADDRIRLFTLGGEALGEFGRPGAGAGAMRYPADIRLDGTLLHVSQTAVDAVTVFDIGAWAPFAEDRSRRKP